MSLLGIGLIISIVWLSFALTTIELLHHQNIFIKRIKQRQGYNQIDQHRHVIDISAGNILPGIALRSSRICCYTQA